MRRRTLLRSSALLSIGAVSTALFGSCAQSSPQATPTAGVPLRVGLVPWIGWSSAQIADVKGFFKEAGVNVQHTVFQTVSEINTALLANQIDIAGMVATDLVILGNQAPDLKFFMATDYSGEVDAILGRGINSPEDLRGKKLAREDIPYEIVFVGRYLASIGLSEKDVEIVSLPAPDAATALISGNVDAAATYAPFVGKTLNQAKDAKVLFTAKDTNIIINGFTASSKVLNDRRTDVLAYMRAYYKALDFAKTNTAEAHEITAKWTGITPEEVTEQMTQVNVFDLAKNKDITFNPSNDLNAANSIDAGGKLLINAKKTTKAIAGSSLIDDSLIKAL
jgi:NitT/TauT family transport system substrate-binding protein